MTTLSRRAFLELATAIGAAAAWCGAPAASPTPPWREDRERFPEGVASADPDSHSVLLWTRCPQQGAASSRLHVEIAADEGFRQIVTRAVVPVAAAADWTCRVLAGGLEPARVYWYRFTDTQGHGSRIGRTRTAPRADDLRPVAFAFVSCQNVNLGAQSAYRRMIYEDERAPPAEQLGFVLHLGDFI